MSYKVNGWDTVEPTISFTCTHCRGGLKAPLTDAGSEHACPTCQVPLIVPGEKELKSWLDERLAIAAQAEHHAEQSQKETPVDTLDDSTTVEPADPLPIPAGRHAAIALVHKCVPFIAGIGALVLFIGLVVLLVALTGSHTAVKAMEIAFIGGFCVSSGFWILLVAAFLWVGLELEDHLRAIRRSLDTTND